ncbi:hypothetical protein R5W23_002709 [Gemmata sp. JC673]|uniref:Lipoprotein n=1 Tax=Gemmata algarum TaxID=2975278 RepID=A0ABU5F6C8_9BACT|nr:hypothetical protein [Gemmata algarum]MDY3561431.1 hypothetical protein [Gemmata algarum]
MNRIAALVAGLALLASTGCLSDGSWSARRLFGPDDGTSNFNPKDVPAASLQTASRVEVLSRRIVVQNTFTGIEPMIFTIGVKEPTLFHRGPNELFISEGLVNKCKTEEELAAVLCSELGQMVAEARNAKSVAREVAPLRDTGHGAGSMVPGGTAYDASQQANLAYHEKRYPRTAPGVDPEDTAKVARELMKGAGFDPAGLEQVQPLVKQSDRGELLRKQLNTSAPAPTWQK